jgi:hypothetical protein
MKEPWGNLHQYNFDHCKSDPEPKIYLKYVILNLFCGVLGYDTMQSGM